MNCHVARLNSRQTAARQQGWHIDGANSLGNGCSRNLQAQQHPRLRNPHQVFLWDSSSAPEISVISTLAGNNP